jgi:hypothetical protein
MWDPDSIVYLFTIESNSLRDSWLLLYDLCFLYILPTECLLDYSPGCSVLFGVVFLAFDFPQTTARILDLPCTDCQ